MQYSQHYPTTLILCQQKYLRKAHFEKYSYGSLTANRTT